MNHQEAGAAGLGRFGAWSPGSALAPDIGAARELAARIDELGFGTLWIGSSDGDLVLPGMLLEATTRLSVATAIVNIWQYRASEVAGARHEVAQSHPGRFLLGIGVGHAPFIAKYERPLAKLESYLDELDAAAHPVRPGERVVAALGPRALRLAAARSRGTCPFLVPPEHTADARARLGKGPLIAPEQKVVLERDASEARRVAREALAVYLTLPNYLANLRRFGLTDDDFAHGGSDRLVDTLVSWGDDQAIRRRLQDHVDAGADHVAVHLLGIERGPEGIGQQMERLAGCWRQVADLLPAL